MLVPPSRPLVDGGLVLRPFADADEPALAKALADPGVARWATGPTFWATPEPERVASWLRVHLAAWSTGTAAFAIADSADDMLLGYVGLRDIHAGKAVVGSWVAPWARRRGVAVGALNMVSAWAFDSKGLRLRRIALHHAALNAAPCELATQAGFLLEGVMRMATTDGHGEHHDTHLHARLASDPGPGDN